jgi:hypothetical protein
METWAKQCESTAAHGKEIIKTINETAKKVTDTLSVRMNSCLDEASSSARTCTPDTASKPTVQKK